MSLAIGAQGDYSTVHIARSSRWHRRLHPHCSGKLSTQSQREKKYPNQLRKKSTPSWSTCQSSRENETSVCGVKTQILRQRKREGIPSFKALSLYTWQSFGSRMLFCRRWGRLHGKCAICGLAAEMGIIYKIFVVSVQNKIEKEKYFGSRHRSPFFPPFNYIAFGSQEDWFTI